VFETSLKQKLKRIFDFDKVTFDRPGESQEQEGVFVEVENARCKLVDAKQIARVTGKLHVFASLEKLPFGYFSKKISEAAAADVKDLFFFDFEENRGTFRNITERSLGFVFLYSSQYDPNVGELTSINFSIAES
jgi:hypothetical protein